jgi:glyoxylase-like metal-dependent hydrolase (beta-lactamase superfamily II)
MARIADRLPENAPGDFWVDSSCIDCDTCRWLASGTFAEGHGTSYVHTQPAGDGARRLAALAVVACPTASIAGPPDLVREAAKAFPVPIEATPDVYYCGYASEDSFGATSYLIRRPEGNVLVDSPRAARPLMDRIEELGGVALMFLSHRDDVADHEAYAARFGCRRVLHADDLGGGTRSVEVQLRGADPIRLADDLLVIPVPGHTRGSTVLLWRDEILFSGDHMWANDAEDGLAAGRGVAWYSWAEQTRSMERLAGHRFQSVLPGHGRRWRAPSADAMAAEVRRLAARMRGTRAA